jgi:hypothetical protein
VIDRATLAALIALSCSDVEHKADIGEHETTPAGTTGTPTTPNTSTPTTSSSPVCADAAVLDALQTHLDELYGTAAALPTDAPAREPLGFLHAPGLCCQDPATLWLVLELEEPCPFPIDPEPSCDHGRSTNCYQLACTGEDAGWSLRMFLDEPLTRDGFSVASAEAEVRWIDGETAVSFAIDAAATGPDGRDWTYHGAGALGQVDGELTASVEATLPALLDGASAELSYRRTEAATEATLSAGGAEIARADAAGKLSPSGACR